MKYTFTFPPDFIFAVAERKLSLAREEALIQLLDDESPVVRNALVEEFQRIGEAGVILLSKVSRGGNRLLASRARVFLEKIQGPDPALEFTRFIRSVSYEIETGCLLLNRVVFPACEPAEVCMRLDAIASRARQLMLKPAAPWEKCRVINRVLFHEYGFRGNTESPDTPSNYCLPQVLLRRKGLPITLCILYQLAAQRCGLNLELVAVPGRYHVGCFLPDEPFYLDPFDRGTARSRDYLAETLISRQITPRDHYFLPATTGDVLCQCCRQLARVYSITNNPRQARIFAGFVREFEEVYQRTAQP